MSETERKHAKIFLDASNCYALIVSEHETVHRFGITEKNIEQLVKVITDRGYHVTLYKAEVKEFYAETDKPG